MQLQCFYTKKMEFRLSRHPPPPGSTCSWWTLAMTIYVYVPNVLHIKIAKNVRFQPWPGSIPVILTCIIIKTYQSKSESSLNHTVASVGVQRYCLWIDLLRFRIAIWFHHFYSTSSDEVKHLYHPRNNRNWLGAYYFDNISIRDNSTLITFDSKSNP